MTRARADGLLLLKLASQVEDLRARVTELENRQRITGQTIARHAEAIEAIGKALNENDGEEIKERTMMQ
jgi:hypothetical protein